MITDPEIIKHICVKDFHIFPNAQDFQAFHDDEVFGKFLIAQRDENWKRMRAILSPTFTSGKMRKMFHVMNNCVDDAIAVLKKVKPEEHVDLHDFCGKYSLDVISR